MGFLAFTYIGLTLAIIHMILPTEHKVGFASAFFVGISGAWGGALLASTLHQGGWIDFGLASGAGAVLGAALSLAGLEVLAERHVHAEERSL